MNLIDHRILGTVSSNSSPVSVDAPADTPLLWVIREHLKLTGTKFGCGVGATARMTARSRDA
jgi:aerobic-type carbon monoxide dehydrogenase small subunit (CoxS/CutS family)